MSNQIGRRIAVTPTNHVEIEEFPVPKPGKGQVLTKTISTLISAGTELGSQEQKRDGNIYTGYSNAGEIIAVGEGVSDYQIGDRVLSLGQHASHVIASTAPQALARIPENVSFDEAAFGVLGSVSMHGVRKARIELGEFVAITGMGLVGQLALQLASRAGSEALIAIDPCDARLRIAEKLGATHALNPDGADFKAEVNSITGNHGLDVTIEASGYPEALLYVFELSRIGGRIVQLGSIWHRIVEVDFMDFHLKELTLTGCHQPKCPTAETVYFPWTQQYNRRQILRMISDGRLNVSALISHKMPYYETEEAYRLLRDEKDKALGVVLDWAL
jgi:2-desacetyl-2-hydroxyethyl bacteriochlorophyllide A dehydrogenase